jgi:uncharacterized protein YkwD
MNKKLGFGILIALLVLAGVGLYFRDSIPGVFKKVGDNLQSFQQENLGGQIAQMTRQVLTSSPLNIGGKPNNVTLSAAKVIALTNIQRFNNGMMPPVVENAQLDLAAKAKAQDMFAKQYFEHVSPSGVDPGQLVKNAGYDYIVSAENLILGNFANEEEMVTDWMNSPGHRANILNDRVVDIGVAVVKGTYKGETVWIGVQEFGLPLSSCPSPNSALKATIDQNQNQLNQLSAQIDQKRQEINQTNRNSSEYNAKVDEYNALIKQYNQLAADTKTLITQYNGQVHDFNDCVAGTSAPAT